MEIILVRHAKAEKRREDLDDIRRYLTEKGKNQFQKRIPQLVEKLEPIEERRVMLWSSPAMRAFETAHLVAQGLQVEIHSVKSFIYSGDFKKFSRNVKRVNESTTLIIVGHEPALSEWTKEMTGKDVKIRKGDILNLKVTNQSPLTAEWQWTITKK